MEGRGKDAPADNTNPCRQVFTTPVWLVPRTADSRQNFISYAAAKYTWISACDRNFPAFEKIVLS